MAEDEKNFYKQALADAMVAVQAEIDLFSGTGGPEATITRHVATNGGWECTEADTWVQDVSGRCSGLATAFQTAYADVEAAWSRQPDRVDVGDWRGVAYR